MNKIILYPDYANQFSESALYRYEHLSGKPMDTEFGSTFCRHDPILLQVIEEMGDMAGRYGVDVVTIEGDRYFVAAESEIHTPETLEWVVIE